MTAAAQRLAVDLRDAGAGLVRLARFDPDWSDWFDASAAGFLRSFAGPLLAVIPYVFVAAVLVRLGPAAAVPSDDRLMLQAALEVLFDGVGYPLLMGVAARVFAFGEGFGAFVVVVNWSQFFLNLLLAGAALFAFFGPNGKALFQVIWLVLLMLSLFITWRAARETLSSDVAPATLAVVLSVAVSAAASQLASLLVPVSLQAAA